MQAKLGGRFLPITTQNWNYDTKDSDTWMKKNCRSLPEKLLPNIRGKPLEPCMDCLAGKQYRVAFHKNVQPIRRKPILDLVHSNVYSMTEKSLGGALYLVIFINDHSRKAWISLLKTKDQDLESFKEFHANLERETRQKLKSIRVDNGWEYHGPLNYIAR